MDARKTPISTAADWAPIVQALFTAIIAICAGYWAWATRADDLHRIEDTQRRARVEMQNEAISVMSRQLGLMTALCNEVALRDLGDKPTLTLRNRQCYEAYIGARSLVFLSEVRIARGCNASESDWSSAWRELSQALRDAGTNRYFPNTVAERWRAIIDMAAPH